MDFHGFYSKIRAQHYSQFKKEQAQLFHKVFPYSLLYNANIYCCEIVFKSLIGFNPVFSLFSSYLSFKLHSAFPFSASLVMLHMSPSSSWSRPSSMISWICIYCCYYNIITRPSKKTMRNKRTNEQKSNEYSARCW